MACGSIDYFLKYICTVVFDVGTPLGLILNMSDDGRFQSRQLFIIISYIILSHFFSLTIHRLMLLCREESLKFVIYFQTMSLTKNFEDTEGVIRSFKWPKEKRQNVKQV
jgi:hypothetical protein